MSGGAGYVLSKEALVEYGLPDPEKCSHLNTVAEDVEIANCLQALDVIAGDSRDSQDRGRFFVFNPITHLFPSEIPLWYWARMFYNTTDVSLIKVSFLQNIIYFFS